MTGKLDAAAERSSGAGTRTMEVERLSRADRVARGKDARALAPLGSHAEFAPDTRLTATESFGDRKVDIGIHENRSGAEAEEASAGDLDDA